MYAKSKEELYTLGIEMKIHYFLNVYLQIDIILYR